MPTSEKFWDKHAEKYDAKTVKGPNYAARLDRVAEWAGETGNVLDVGCAAGEITLDIAPRVGAVHGIDISPRMIELASAKATERDIRNAQFSAVDPADSSLGEGTFDAITLFSVFHLVDDVEAMLPRLRDLLRPGGVLITETPCIGSWNPLWRVLVVLAVLTRMAPKVRVLKVDELESMIAAAGFEVEESKVYNPKSRMQCIMARRR